MRRRDFIAAIGGAVAWPPSSPHAQQPGRVRRVGILMNAADNSPVGQARLAQFVERLKELGWTDGRNLHLDIRWGADDFQRYRRYAMELVALEPDVITADTSIAVAALQQASGTVPIVFARTIDPVGAGFVETLGQPGGNTTGFLGFEYALSGKWLGLLREIAPNVTRAAVLRDPSTTAGIGQFAAIQATAQTGIELSAVDERDPGSIERALARFARRSYGGLLVTAAPFGTNHPDVITTLAARYKLPAVYPFRYFVEAGGLISYGPDTSMQFRMAADYVNRILNGEKPADLPVQAPTKYELVINAKVANALGLTVPASLIARADEVIE
jgi:putative ABC transport system substrate-binding protein